MTLYTTVSDFLSQATGWALAGTLPERHDQILWALVEASDQAERIIGGRRLAQPLPTSLAVDAVDGAGFLDLKDVSRIADGSAIVAMGATYRVLGVELTAPHLPGLPGRAFVTPFVTGDASAGSPVLCFHEDRWTLTQMGPNPYGAESILAIPDADRTLWLEHAPIRSLHAVFHVLPGAGETSVDLSNVTIEPNERQIRLAGDVTNPLRTEWRVQYSGGYPVVPYSVREAIHLLAASRFAMRSNPTGSTEVGQEDTRLKAVGEQFRQRATEILVGSYPPCPR